MYHNYPSLTNLQCTKIGHPKLLGPVHPVAMAVGRLLGPRPAQHVGCGTIRPPCTSSTFPSLPNVFWMRLINWVCDSDKVVSSWLRSSCSWRAHRLFEVQESAGVGPVAGCRRRLTWGGAEEPKKMCMALIRKWAQHQSSVTWRG